MRRVLAFVLLFGLLATACGAADTETGTAAAPEDATESSTATEPAAAEASLLTGEYETIGGETVDLATYEGQDVVLWFWAPW